MIDRRLAGLVVTAAVLLAAGCGDGSDNAPSSAKAASTALSASRSVTASVDGRKLSGHCIGAPRKGSPPILLESGMRGGQAQLVDLERRLAKQTLVCAYDRAGVGASDPPSKNPRPVRELVADLDAFATATKAKPPYVLVGQSMGGNIVFVYAQTHPEKVAGFVSMNPGPPAETYLPAIKKVETKDEYAGELADYGGHTGEGASFREPTLAHALPATMPYVVMFDEDCEGDTDFCDRILPTLTRTTRSLAAVGDGGRFVRAKGAGHNIFQTDPELVEKTISGVLNGTS